MTTNRQHDDQGIIAWKITNLMQACDKLREELRVSQEGRRSIEYEYLRLIQYASKLEVLIRARGHDLMCDTNLIFGGKCTCGLEDMIQSLRGPEDA